MRDGHHDYPMCDGHHDASHDGLHDDPLCDGRRDGSRDDCHDDASHQIRRADFSSSRFGELIGGESGFEISDNRGKRA